MRSLIAYIWTHRYRVLLGLFALLLVDSGKLMIPQIIRVAVDQVTAGNDSWLLIFGLVILGIGVVITVFRFLWRYWLLGAARMIRKQVRSDLYAHLLTCPGRFFHERQTGDLMAHFSNDTAAVMRASGIGLLAIADFAYMTVLTVIFMLYIDVELTLYAFIPLPFLSVFVYVFGRLIHHRFQDVQDTFSDMSDRVEEALSAIYLVKSSAHEEAMEDHFGEENENYLERNLSLVKFEGGMRPGIVFFSGLSMLIVLYMGGSNVVRGSMSLGELVAFVQYLGMMTWPMMALGMGINAFQRGSASMERIDDLLGVEPETDLTGKPVPYTGGGSISVENLTFSYDDDPVLEDVSFSVSSGASIGVLGRTGAGKTTLIRLLSRVYNPPASTVHIGDRDIRSYELSSLRKQIGVVPQSGFLFSTSVRENIAFGRPDASLEQVTRVARIAGIHEEVERMPDGYDTHVGEEGVALSGGQKQRVAIARAILTDPDVLLFDDALSSVDARKKDEILQSLQPEFEGRTCVIVSHRIATVKRFGRIIVLDDGRIVEEGTHRELVNNDALYARLFALQKRREEVHG
jgi:ATP-binding cassette subfamily B protein